MRYAIFSALVAALAIPGPAQAREFATVKRINADTVELTRENADPVAVWISKDARIDAGDRLVAPQSKARQIKLPLSSDSRQYILLLEQNGKTDVVAERLLPLEQGSNFRDIGGYVTKDGKAVRWGKAFRSGAMPLLTDGDYALIGRLGLGTVVDLRSLEERSLNADKIDDRTGALFVSNDYSMKTLFAGLSKNGGEHTYRGIEKLLIPQLRSLYRQLMADGGAVLYHCSAGQDRTGIATALLYDVLGVDRETILKDYHLSTQFRRPEWEMPAIDPADYPDNALVQYYASLPESKRKNAQPLYTPSGASHLAQFFGYLDQTYGGSEGYMKTALGFSDGDIARLRSVMLD